MSETGATVRADRPLRVLQSFPEPRPTTNPYLVMLQRALDDLPDVEVLTFSWRRALTAGYDVVHVHWPEILLAGRDPARSLARRLLFLLFLLRLSLTATPVVRTLHNLRPHSGTSRLEALLLRRLDRRTTAVIILNQDTPVPADVPSVTVLHGHYRDWFGRFQRPRPEPFRAAFVGLVRPYKNIPALVTAFRAVLDRAPQARLEVAGAPASEELAARLREAAGGVPQVELSLRFVPDDRLVEIVGRAEVVVLPYREMHNSGAVLLALSLDRPVLVPDNEITARLAEEVGPEWVLRYRGELTGERVLAAFEEARRIPPGARPDLGRREWNQAGLDHRDAYRRARAAARHR